MRSEVDFPSDWAYTWNTGEKLTCRVLVKKVIGEEMFEARARVPFYLFLD
jgi:hypothetical protein